MNPWSPDGHALNLDISVSLPAFKNAGSPHAHSTDSDNEVANEIFASALDLVRTESEEN